MEAPEASLLPDQAVQVTADEEWLRAAVVNHPSLAWSEECSSLLGAAGLFQLKTHSIVCAGFRDLLMDSVECVLAYPIKPP